MFCYQECDAWLKYGEPFMKFFRPRFIGHHKATKVTEPDFGKKIEGVTNVGKNIFEVFLKFFPIS